MKNDNEEIFYNRKKELILITIDILDKTLHSGLINLVDYFDNKKNILNDIIYEYYKKGLNMIINGRSPNQISLFLECEKMEWIRDTTVTSNDLQLITIIANIIPYLQHINFEGILDLCYDILLKKDYNEIYDLLQKIKLNDNYKSLNQ